MLFTGRLVAAVRIARELETQTGIIDSAANKLVRTVIALGDERAYKIHEESVHVVRNDAVADDSDFALEALWSPLSAALVGGEYDGDRINVRRESDGLPLPILTLPYRAAPQVSERIIPAPTSNPSYRRSGIDPITDEWVYTLLR